MRRIKKKKREENSISTMKTYQMPNQTVYVNDSCIITHNYKTHLNYCCL